MLKSKGEIIDFTYRVRVKHFYTTLSTQSTLLNCWTTLNKHCGSAWQNLSNHNGISVNEMANRVCIFSNPKRSRGQKRENEKWKWRKTKTKIQRMESVSTRNEMKWNKKTNEWIYRGKVIIKILAYAQTHSRWTEKEW